MREGTGRFAETNVTDPAAPMTPADNQNRWGPFLNYEYITTPHGLYGLPARQLLWFEDESVYDYKLQQNVVRPMPHYEEVDVDDPRILPDYDAVLGGKKKK